MEQESSSTPSTSDSSESTPTRKRAPRRRELGNHRDHRAGRKGQT